jgi:hypothetical protein
LATLANGEQVVTSYSYPSALMRLLKGEAQGRIETNSI